MGLHDAFEVSFLEPLLLPSRLLHEDRDDGTHLRAEGVAPKDEVRRPQLLRVER